MHTYAINRSLKKNKFHVSPIKIKLERNETILISGRKTSNLDFLVFINIIICHFLSHYFQSLGLTSIINEQTKNLRG